MKILWRYILLFSLSAFFLTLPLQAMECSRLLSEGLNKDLEDRFLGTTYVRLHITDINRSSFVETFSDLRVMSEKDKELLIDYMMDRGFRGLAIVDYGTGDRYGDFTNGFVADFGHPPRPPYNSLPLRIPLIRTGEGSIIRDGRLIASIKLERELSSLFPARISVWPEKMPVGFRSYYIILNFFKNNREYINTMIENLNVRNIVIGDLSGYYSNADPALPSLRDTFSRFDVDTSVGHYGHLLPLKEFDYLRRGNTIFHIAVQREPQNLEFFGRLHRVFRPQSRVEELERGVDVGFLEEQILRLSLDRVY